MQNQFIASQPVLDKDGRPNAGWANRGILQYNRNAIKASPFRIKEWDWFQALDDTKALQFTLGHASYAGQVGIMLFDFEKGENIFIKDKILALPFGSLHLEANADTDGVLLYDKRGMYMRFETKGDVRFLQARCKNFEAEVTLTRQNPNALVINVPFNENPTAFYYNHKINCMTAQGKAIANGKEYIFEENAWGLLDWGRGVWPFHNEWYWSNASGYIDGHVFGFNLGCGFGNTSAATENCLFYGGAIHKLNNINILLDKKDYNKPWHLVDDEGRLDLVLEPVYDRQTKIKMLWVDNCTHQMFGKFCGKAVLDDGKELKIENITGFAEHAVNNW